MGVKKAWQAIPICKPAKTCQTHKKPTEIKTIKKSQEKTMSAVTTRLKKIEQDIEYELRIRCVLSERLALKKPPASGKGLGFTDLLALLKLWTQHCIAKNGIETTQEQVRAALPILDCLIPWLTDGARVTESNCAAIAGRYTHGSS